MRARTPYSRGGFTTIELIVVIAIIAILASILIVGARSVIESSKAGSTRTTLTALQGMLTEYEVGTHFNKVPGEWYWCEAGSVKPEPATSGNAQFDYWHVPFKDTTVTPAIPDPLDAPGSFSDETTRNLSRQVLATQVVMNYLVSMPANSAALQKLPANRYFTPTMPAMPGTLSSPGTDGFLGYGSNSTETVKYPLGLKMLDASGSRWISIAPNNSTAPTVGNWSPDTSSAAAPLLTDAWNNPIIFVPATGLRVLLRNGQSNYGFQESPQVDHPEQRFIIISPEGKAINNGSATLVPTVTQVGRPFFASAGPDGDLSAGDDNIYSFESTNQ